MEMEDIEFLIIETVVMAVLYLFPVWRIFKRAGLNPALSLTVVIPYVGYLLSGAILIASEWKLGAATQGKK
jgi:hypothetical protein